VHHQVDLGVGGLVLGLLGHGRHRAREDRERARYSGGFRDKMLPQCCPTGALTTPKLLRDLINPTRMY
jgi:hypothetical protein